MISKTARKENRTGVCVHAILKAFRNSVFLLTLVFFFTSSAFSQLTTADIVGTVTDATGAVVPNAAVVLTNLGTNDKRTGQTNGSGDYSFTLLPVGHYSISVKAGGFQESINRDLAVEAGDRARADVQQGERLAAAMVREERAQLGEHSARVRGAVCGALAFLGVTLDLARNQAHESTISIAESAAAT